MSEELKSGLGPGLDIEQDSASKILQDYIKLNWPTVQTNPDLPLQDKIDFGAWPDRTNKTITLRCYRVVTNVYDQDVGSHMYAFDIPVAVDIYLRDIKAPGLRQESLRLIAIETYLRDFTILNRLGLRDKGVDHIDLVNSEVIPEPLNETSEVWFHLVVTIRMYYWMNRVPV